MVYAGLSKSSGFFSQQIAGTPPAGGFLLQNAAFDQIVDVSRGRVLGIFFNGRSFG
jgi:hypothetical protein